MQNSNCYHCGQQGHWASDCPIKDIPAYDQEFWNDIDSLVGKEMQTDDRQSVQEEAQPVPQAPPAPKKRKLSLKKKDNQ